MKMVDYIDGNAFEEFIMLFQIIPRILKIKDNCLLFPLHCGSNISLSFGDSVGNIKIMKHIEKPQQTNLSSVLQLPKDQQINLRIKRVMEKQTKKMKNVGSQNKRSGKRLIPFQKSTERNGYRSRRRIKLERSKTKTDDQGSNVRFSCSIGNQIKKLVDQEYERYLEQSMLELHPPPDSPSLARYKSISERQSDFQKKRTIQLGLSNIIRDALQQDNIVIQPTQSLEASQLPQAKYNQKLPFIHKRRFRNENPQTIKNKLKKKNPKDFKQKLMKNVQAESQSSHNSVKTGIIQESKIILTEEEKKHDLFSVKIDQSIIQRCIMNSHPFKKHF